MKKVYIYGAIVLVVLLGVGFYFLMNKESNSEIACTMDAKICPDGSAVGRTGPNCEFAPCPKGEVEKKVSMVERTDDIQKIKFSYPEKLGATYITPAEWPPKVVLKDGKLACEVTYGFIPGRPVVALKTIGKNALCVSTQSEGAAGTTYIDATYALQQGSKIVSANVVLANVNCGVYDEPNRSECQKERSQFNLDPIMDSIISSVKEIK